MPHRVGIDLTSVAAVREAAQAHGERYLRRVYTPAELAECAGDAARLAGRFAAKEAAIKVLRPGPADALPWQGIEVVRAGTGHVELRLSGLAAARAAAQGLEGFAVSLSHEGDSACAVVLAESAAPGLPGSCR